MIIRRTRDFLKDIESLPKEIREILKKQEEVFIKSRLDQRLHIKKIKGINNCYSFRVTRKYRVLFYFRDKEAVFFKIGHRKDVYK